MASHTGTLENARSSANKSLHAVLDFIKRHYNTILAILTVLMILLAALLVYLLVTKTFLHEFSCTHVIDEATGIKALNTSLCDGAAFNIKSHEVIPPIQIIPKWVKIIPPWDIGPVVFGPISFPILPPFSPINNLLTPLRQFVAWNIILAFGVISLVLAFIVIKVKGFIKVLMTPEGRKAILTNISIWLLIFAIFCTMFYFMVVVGG